MSDKLPSASTTKCSPRPSSTSAGGDDSGFPLRDLRPPSCPIPTHSGGDGGPVGEAGTGESGASAHRLHPKRPPRLTCCPTIPDRLRPGLEISRFNPSLAVLEWTNRPPVRPPTSVSSSRGIVMKRATASHLGILARLLPIVALAQIDPAPGKSSAMAEPTNTVNRGNR